MPEKMKQENKTGAQNGGKQKKEAEANMKRIMAAKQEAFKLEQENDRRLIAFISKGGWYKLGGMSAMYYYHLIAKRLGLKPRLISDSDFFSKFKEGIVSIRNIDTLEKNLAKLKIYRNAQLTVPEDLYVFELGYVVSDENIKAMLKDEETRKMKLNKMVLPEMAMPELHAAIQIAVRKAYQAIRKMPSVDRELFGQSAYEKVNRMYKNFHLMASGIGKKKKLLEEMLVMAEVTKSTVKMGVDLGAWEMNNALQVAEALVTIERLVRKELRAEKEKDAEKKVAKKATGKKNATGATGAAGTTGTGTAETKPEVGEDGKEGTA